MCFPFLLVNLTVKVAFVPAFCEAVSFTERVCRLFSRRLPVPSSDTVTVFVLPAAILTVVLPSTTVRLVFFGLCFEALTAITLLPDSVSTTDSVSVTVHELPAGPANEMDVLAVVPETFG